MDGSVRRAFDVTCLPRRFLTMGQDTTVINCLCLDLGLLSVLRTRLLRFRREGREQAPLTPFLKHDSSLTLRGHVRSTGRDASLAKVVLGVRRLRTHRVPNSRVRLCVNFVRFRTPWTQDLIRVVYLQRRSNYDRPTARRFGIVEVGRSNMFLRLPVVEVNLGLSYFIESS